MKIKSTRNIDGKILLEGNELKLYLPDGVYQNNKGHSITVKNHEIKGVFAPLDIEAASAQDIKDYLKYLEDKLSALEEDAQLENIDIPSLVKKQQQTIQMAINLSKLLHDTALAVVRKMQ